MDVARLRNVSDLVPVDRDLVGQHARRRNLDGVRPVVIVVAERVRKVQNGLLAEVGSVLCHIEMSWLNRTLGDRVRSQEEVELSVNYLRLLDEASVDVSALWRVEDLSLSLFLEEPLANSLVNENKCNVRVLVFTVNFLDDLLQLVQLVMNDLRAHRVTDTVSVDKNVVGHVTIVVVLVCFESVYEVVKQNLLGDDFFAFDFLRAGLREVLAHVRVVRGTEANDGLLTLVTDIDSHEHSFLRDVFVEVHTPQVSTKLGVDLSENIDEDAVVVLHNGLSSHELRDHRRVSVNLALNSSVELLLPDMVWHDDKEEVVFRPILLRLLSLAFSTRVLRSNFVVVKTVDSLLEVINARPVIECNNVTVVNVNSHALLLREVIELVLNVLSILNILFDAENGPSSKAHGLVNDLRQNLRVFEGFRLASVSLNSRSRQDLGFYFLRLMSDLNSPVSKFLRLRDKPINVFNTVNTLVRPLEERLTQEGHLPLAFPHFSRDTDQGAKLRREEDRMFLLFYFEQGLLRVLYLQVVILFEILQHRDLTAITLLEAVLLRVEVPLDARHLVSSVWPVASHDDRAIKFAGDVVLIVPSQTLLYLL